ncbi:MAG: class I SAM-dependent methyltransferase [Polyangia bacterium]|jgi:SAM-dependent methyltransferase|nr:class I SAM-dependent methyltransferase [Polyangia bacterium]
MEHVLHISALDDLRHFYGRRFDRLYFGAEFCPWTLPSPDHLKQALAFCARHGLDFSLVTPTLTEPHLGTALALMEELPAGTEVVLNDWGLLEAASALGLVPVLGRALLKVKRDPRIGSADLESVDFARYLRSSSLNQAAFLGFLKDRGIVRAELDNVPQGYELKLPPWLHTSLYYPYVFTSVTRRCSLMNGDRGALADGSCRDRCGLEVVRAALPARRGDRRENTEYFMAGPLIFFVNDRQPQETDGWNLDRAVFQPRPPVQATTPSLCPFEDWNAVYERRGRDVQWGHDDPDETLLGLLREASRSSSNVAASPSRSQQSIDASRILDLGCGNGRNAVAMRALGLDVIGIDLARAALRQYRLRASDAPVLHANVLKLPFGPSSFDGVVDSGCFHALLPSLRHDYASEVQRLLAPGAWLLIVARQHQAQRSREAPVFFAETVLPEWGVGPEELSALFAPDLSLQMVRDQQGRGEESFTYYLFKDSRSS